MAPYYKILNMLRSSGVNSEIYTGDGGIKAQMKYADRRNSPAVILYGENETLVYKTKKYGIPCERKFEINATGTIVGFTSSGCI